MKAPTLDINLFDVSFLLDPYPVYEEIRAAGRVVWNSRLHLWMVPGYDDCMEILADRGDKFVEPNSDPEMVFWFEAPNMIMVDGREHNRLHAGLAPLFTRQAIAKWERRISEVVDELLKPLLERPEGFDLIADFSWVPTIIVAEMLGIPKERHDDFRRWSHIITANLAYGHEDPEVRQTMVQAATQVNNYVSEEVKRHRKQRPDDLITAMLGFGPPNDLSDEEIVSTAIELLIAGYDTTAKVMSNCLVVLERHPDQRRIVADDLSLVPQAVEEVLRFWGLLQMNPRYVTANTKLAGVGLSEGDVLYALPAAANRDPSRWPDPHKFDVLRAPKAHMGFGYGPHLCVGMHLARLETKVAVERLLKLAPEYRLRDIDFGRSSMVRGLERGIVEPGRLSIGG